MQFSVVIPTMRREEILDATLESLKRCDPAPSEVIVIDADPEGSSRPVVTAFDEQVAPAVRYLRSVPSLTRQRNLGIDDASGDVIVFLDDDVTIQPDLFARLAEVYGDASVIGATGHVIEPESGRVGGPAHRCAGCSSAAVAKARSRATDTRAICATSTSRETSNSCRAAS